MFLRIAFIGIFVCALSVSFGQNTKGPLLLDPQIEIEATVAVNALYNFDFKKAETEFQWLKYRYPNHPMPYFLLGFCQWWKILPYDIESVPKKDVDKLVAYMDSCIYFAEELYDEDDKNIDAIFFLSASYGFLGRIYADQQQWTKATWAGRNALKYLGEAKEQLNISPEFLFGDGLVNYYTEWIKENYVFLRPVLLFFPNGNKELGIKQLEQASQSAFYTRTESQYWLMYIYSEEEGKDNKALPIAKYLSETFPNNAYFKRFYASISWSQGRYRDAEQLSLDLLAGIDSNVLGYEPVSGRYASYYLGYINYLYNSNWEAAEDYFKRCIKYSLEVKNGQQGYYKYSHIYLARIRHKKGDLTGAMKYYKQFMAIEKNNKSSNYKEAKKFVDENKKAVYKKDIK